MTKKPNLQELFLDFAAQNKAQCSILTCNGVRLIGVIQGHDAYTVQLKLGASLQSIYKSAIMTIGTDSVFEVEGHGWTQKMGGQGKGRQGAAPISKSTAKPTRVVNIARRPATKRQ